MNRRQLLKLGTISAVIPKDALAAVATPAPAYHAARIILNVDYDAVAKTWGTVEGEAAYEAIWAVMMAAAVTGQR